MNIQPAHSLKSFFEVQKVQGQHQVTKLCTVPPLKVLFPKTSPVFSHAILSQYGGGMVGGDAIQLSFTIGPKTKLVLSTQGYSRAYTGEKESSQILEATLCPDAEAYVLPDPLVLHQNSSFHSQQCYQLSASSTLLLCETVVFGRLHREERFDFKSYSNQWKIYREGNIIYNDTQKINPSILNHLSPATFGPCTSLCTMVWCAPIHHPYTDIISQQLKMVQSWSVAPDENHTLGHWKTSWQDLGNGIYIFKAMGTDAADLMLPLKWITTALANSNILGCDLGARKH